MKIDFRKYLAEQKKEIKEGTKARRSIYNKAQGMIYDPVFLKNVAEHNGMWLDDAGVPYFEKVPGTHFMSADEFSKRYAGGGGVKLRQDMSTGEEFWSAGSAHRKNISYKNRQLGRDNRLKSVFGDEFEDKPKKEISPLADLGFDRDTATEDELAYHDEDLKDKELIFKPRFELEEGKNK